MITKLTPILIFGGEVGQHGTQLVVLMHYTEITSVFIFSFNFYIIFKRAGSKEV